MWTNERIAQEAYTISAEAMNPDSADAQSTIRKWVAEVLTEMRDDLKRANVNATGDLTEEQAARRQAQDERAIISQATIDAIQEAGERINGAEEWPDALDKLVRQVSNGEAAWIIELSEAEGRTMLMAIDP